jgi:signal transduction histidine kinase
MRESPEGRSLVIRTFTDGRTVAGISIRDAGEGIAAKDMPHIFDPLYTTKADGLGMGLAIARTIIEAHAGRLTATNNDDGGATFQFTLPHARAAPR